MTIMAASPTAYLDPATTVGPVVLTTRDRAALSAWYTRVLGLRELAADDRALVLGAADGRPLLVLVEDRDARPGGRRQPGLYHTAFLLPSRADLGRWLRHMAEIGVRIAGASDHLVSEATYLADPEGNGIEVYRDRPRGEWPMVEGRIHMDNAPFDLRGVVGEGDAAGGTWTGAPAGTVVGHVHLKVSDVEASRRFYVDGLGFAPTEEGYPSALFVAAGGYHHHFGLNAWESAGAARTEGTTGLRGAVVSLPVEARAATARRLEAAGIPLVTGAAADVAVDPSGNRILFVSDPLDARSALVLAA